MKKVLIVTRVSGFLPQFERNNVKHLQELGYEVHYASNFHTIVYGQDNSRLEELHVHCHQIDFVRSIISRDNLRAYKQLKKLLQKEKFALIHCHMPLSGVLTRLAVRNLGLKTNVLYTAHGFHFYTGAPLKNWIYYPIERFFARYTDILITITKEDYRRAKRFPVRGEVYRIRGVGPDLTGFYEIERSKNPASFTLISVGELTDRKNHRLVLEALAKIKSFGKNDIRYLICGSGPLEQELKRLVKNWGLCKQVIFLGYCTDVAEALSQAVVFVFPSKQEGLPVALMEAMAAGLPVLGTDIRGNRELIRPGKGGLLFPVQDAAVLAAEILKLKALSVEERKKMGAYNRRRSKFYAKEAVGEQMKRIYVRAEM